MAELFKECSNCEFEEHPDFQTEEEEERCFQCGFKSNNTYPSFQLKKDYKKEGFYVK